MYKVGDKVLFNGKEATIIDINESQKVMTIFYKVEDEAYDIVEFNDVLPYTSAHEKLLALGFEYEDNKDHKRYRHLAKGSFIIWDDKTFTTSECDLKLARIMVQYLEELEITSTFPKPRKDKK